MEAVLQLHCLGVNHQLVQHGGQFGDTLVVLVFLVDACQRTAETGLGFDVIAHLKVDVAGFDLGDGFVGAVLRALFDGKFVVGKGIGGIPLIDVDVADGVIDLVEEVLVLVGLRHAFKHLYHLSVIRA
ncbi:hypothetical protein Barb4_01086 [Bacteroidales bacterium Barb4]|nr:hypothetical protein Barb4_01086 [Bacteroidales bacterium Barb4]